MARHRGKFRPVPRGATPVEDFHQPLGLSVNRTAMDLRVPATRISAMVPAGSRTPPRTRRSAGSNYRYTRVRRRNLHLEAR